MKNKNLFIVLLLLFPLWVWASPYSVKRLDAIEGLTSNYVLSIAQDKQGFLWFATEEGLNKFRSNCPFLCYYKSAQCR